MKVGLGEAIGSVRPLVVAAKLVAACVLVTNAVGPAAAADPPRSKILTCKDVNGNPIITDPSDPRCYKPPLTEPEKAAADERKRRDVELYNACKAEQRSLQSLLSRYPDKAKHDAARRKAPMMGYCR